MYTMYVHVDPAGSVCQMSSPAVSWEVARSGLELLGQDLINQSTQGADQQVALEGGVSVLVVNQQY